MPRRVIPLIAGQYYHVFNRGNNRQAIFFERENYLILLRRMREVLVSGAKTSEVSKTSDVWTQVIAYCLMPNHYHLLVHPQDDNFSRRMQRLSISYTKAINKRYQRVGALFQGQFQAVYVDSNEYLLRLSRYLHLNPVIAGLVKRPEAWEFSSYRDYIGLRQGTLAAPGIVLDQFESRHDYQEFVEAYREPDRQAIAHLLLDND